MLGGVAVEHAGPSALIAFLLNGTIAFLTVFCLAELVATFPESGGAYTFAKKVLSIRAAFTVGWVVCFAHLVAGLLYALGFAAYLESAVLRMLELFSTTPPTWLPTREMRAIVGALAVAYFTRSLIVKAGGGSNYANVAKVLLFAALILFGLVVFIGGDSGALVSQRLSSFAPFGLVGILTATGYTFIIFQGFESIASVAGEIAAPRKTVPKAMSLALGIAILLYLPLLFLVLTVGAPPDQLPSAWCGTNPETCFADAAENFIGPVGYWIVAVAALLGTLTALYANLLTASRILQVMALDRTLPPAISRRHATYSTPMIAVLLSGLSVLALVAAVPDVSTAGAAASLVFLLGFSLAHLTCFLARVRGVAKQDSYRTPFFPLVPVLGGVACISLAVFQGIVVPGASAILIVWLLFGLLLYYARFASRAETLDAFTESHNPELLVARGRTPFVLVPITNPANAPALVDVAHALGSPELGRVLLLSVVVSSVGEESEEIAKKITTANTVLREGLTTSLLGQARPPEALITVAENPWKEIRRVIKAHNCESLLLGVNSLDDSLAAGPLEEFLSQIRSDVALLNAPPEWKLDNVDRVLVPIGGVRHHDRLRAQVLGALVRGGVSRIHLVRFVPADASANEIARFERELQLRIRDEVRGFGTMEVIADDNVPEAIVKLAHDYDLVITGLYRSPAGRIQFGSVTASIVREAPCATLMVGTSS